MRPKIAFVTFGDHRKDMWEKVFSKPTTSLHEKCIEELKKLPIDLVCADISRTREQIYQNIDKLKIENPDILIAHIPCWTSPNLVADGVVRMGLYTIVLGNKNPATHGCVGTLGAAGTLGQIGYNYSVVRSDYDSEIYKEKLMPLISGVSAFKKLKGSVMGLFGGRSIGIETATYDPMQWKALFGVDSEHIDQIEIVRFAEIMLKEDYPRVEKTRKWIENNAKEVCYNDTLFTKEKFDFQLACYLATKDLIKSNNLDFVAIKCMPELSNSYAPQCMTQTLLACCNDAEGDKEPIPMSCEADADSALTQQILRIISDNKPTLFADVSHINDEKSMIYCVNCGALCAYYANRNKDTTENLKHITFKQSIRPAGAAISFFYASPGPIQLARLYRKNGKYKMAIIPAIAEVPTKEMVDDFVAARGVHQLPLVFAKVNMDIDRFVNEYGSNHISAVEGNYTEELINFCKFAGIEAEVFQ